MSWSRRGTFLLRSFHSSRPSLPRLERSNCAAARKHFKFATRPFSSQRMASTEKDVANIHSLFSAIEERFPHAGVGPEAWYLVTIAAFMGTDQPEVAAQLYTYLLGKPQYQTNEARKEVLRRLRDALFKLVGVCGIPKPLVSLFSIDAVTKPEDQDHSFDKKDWLPGTQNVERGETWLRQIYQANLDPIWKSFGAHKDFEWLEKEIIYGLFLSDHTILNGTETELVTLVGIMVQNLRQQAHWHLRGTRRIGVSQDDVEEIHKCVELVAEHFDFRVDKLPRVADIEHEV